MLYIENDLVRLWIPAGALPLDPAIVGAALRWLHSLRLPLLFTIIFHHSDWAGYNPDYRGRFFAKQTVIGLCLTSLVCYSRFYHSLIFFSLFESFFKQIILISASFRRTLARWTTKMRNRWMLTDKPSRSLKTARPRSVTLWTHLTWRLCEKAWKWERL